MSSPTKRLAILNCKDILPLFDLIEDITNNYIILQCISKSNNTCFVVSSSIDNNIKIYEILNNLEYDDCFLDCRFVGDEIEFASEKEIAREVSSVEKKINESNLEKKVNESNVEKDNIESNLEKEINESNVEKKVNESNVEKDNIEFDLYDKRFIEMYTNDDFVIDTSHDEYKKCAYLKYFIEARRNYH